MKRVFNDFEVRESSLSSQKINLSVEQLKKAFSSVKEQFEEHLSAINDNTNEIQANFEYLCELDKKLDKITERLDQLQFFLEKHGFKAEKKPTYNVKPLTKNEQDIFLILYTQEDMITYKNLARKAALTEELAQSYVIKLVEKGIPIEKKYINNMAFVRLNKQFKAIQAKENILKLEQKSLDFA